MIGNGFLLAYLIVFGLVFVAGTTWNWFFAGDLTLIEMALISVPATLVVRGLIGSGSMNRGGRTSRWAIFWRAYPWVLGANWILASLWNWAAGVHEWGFVQIAVIALFEMLIYGGIAWAGVHAFGAVVYGDDPEYQRFRQSGGDPYFDNDWFPFNPDAEATRQTGISEPEVSRRKPASWRHQCHACGCRTPYPNVCLNCQDPQAYPRL